MISIKKVFTTFAIPFMLLPAVASAQAVVVATVNIYDAKIASQAGNDIQITFDLSNRTQVQPDVRYSVQLIKQDNGQQIQVDEKIYDENLTLNENQTIKKEITYTAPRYLSGEFQVWLTAKNQNGLTLALANPGEITLTGNGQYVEVSGCYLKVAGEAGDKKYTLTQGVDIKSSEKLLAYCDVTNHLAGATTLTPHFTTNWRTTFGQAVETNTEKQPVITLAKGEKKQIQLTLPLAQVPQAYDATLVLQNSQNQTISNKTTFHYVLRGLSATIQNLRLDKDYYKKGDTAKASFFWSASADNFPDSRLGKTDNGKMFADITITDSQGKTCATLQKELDQKTSVVEYDLPISIDCVNPKVAVSIKDGAGTALDKKDFVIESQSAPTNNLIVKIGIVLGAILGLIICVWVMLRYRNKKAVTAIVFLLLVSGMFLVGGSVARADTYTLMSNDTTIVVNAKLDKKEYAPGEKIVASGQIVSATCSNGGNIPGLSLSVTINGSNKIIPRDDNPAFRIAVFNAENIAGLYNAVFKAGNPFMVFIGGVSFSIPYTVVAPPPPVAGTCNTTTTASSYVSAPSSNLCTKGTPSTVIGNSTTHKWEWTCAGTGGGAPSPLCTATAPAPTLSFTGNATIIKGASTNLNWTATNVPKCVAWGGTFGPASWGTDKGLTGPESVSPLTTTSYQMQCWNNLGQGTVQKTVTVTVTAAAPVAGTCGTSAKTYASTATAFSGSLCTNGSGVSTPASPSFPSAGNSTTWTCGGSNGGASSGTCTASRSAASCAATTIAGCVLPGTSSGSSAGTCDIYGTCNYTCNNGTWNENSNDCELPISITVSPSSYSATLPAHTANATYTLTNATSVSAKCRLLDYNKNAIPGYNYGKCTGSMKVSAPSTVGAYSYYIQAKSNYTGQTAISNGFTLSIKAAPISDSCGTSSGTTPLLSEPTTGTAACTQGAYANSPADVTTSGSQAWRWSCGTVTTCTAPKYGCTTTTDTNYNPTGPNNTYNCANTCANGGTNYPTCTAPAPGGGSTPCSADVINDCSLSATSSGGSSGSCAGSGTCSYTCGNGIWSETSNTCTPAACTAQTMGACVLSDTASGGTSGTCNSSYEGACTYTCTNGTWGQPSSDTCSIVGKTATISASPTLVPSGGTTKISWSSTGVAACTITGTNGFSKSGKSGTNIDSGAITTQTKFSMSCDGGAATDAVIVNVVPVYQEF